MSSSQFKFIVGPQKKEFTIHAALVAHQSKALDRLVNGDMKEAQEQCALLEATDEQTFIRFSQYVYTGDYYGAEHQQSEPTLSEPRRSLCRPSEHQDHHANIWGKQQPQQPSLWDEFKGLYPNPAPHPASTVDNSGDGSYAEVFFSHARLYVFADYYAIDTLRSLCLCKIHRILVAFPFKEEKIGDIVQLVRYCYENTADQGDEVVSLRTLVNMYTACKVEHLWRSDDFQSLLETTGEYSRGLVGEIIRRLK